MLKVKLENFNYHRLLKDNVSSTDLIEYKNEFDYSFVISYNNFIDEEYDIIKKESALIDLSKPIDMIFKNFKSTCRKHIRRTFNRQEFQVIKNIDEFESLYSFYKSCEMDRNWYPIPEDEIKNSHVMICKFNGIYCSGITAYSHKKKIRLGRLFSGRKSKINIEKNFFSWALRRLVYEYCIYGQENGFETLDLGGIDLTDEKKEGITLFKKSFSPEIIPVKIGRYIKKDFYDIKLKIEKSGYDIT